MADLDADDALSIIIKKKKKNSIDNLPLINRPGANNNNYKFKICKSDPRKKKKKKKLHN